MDNFNERTKEYIKSIAPDLFDEINEKEYKGNKFYDFVIKRNLKEIILCSENDEYSVFFSTFHCHFTPDTESEEKETLEKAIIFINDLIQEKIIIVAYFVDERMIWGTCINFDDKPEIQTNRRIEIESWKDTYTRTIHAQKNDA